MSLLDVFVVLAYYNKAEKKKKKITNQRFDNEYVLAKIKEIKQYYSSALHWNLSELKNNLENIIEKVQNSYDKIEKETGVKLHSSRGIANFKNKINQDISQFMQSSREKAQKAQMRECTTIQPKERLSKFTKAKLTIENYLGGQYFFTVDEVQLDETVSLIETKHSKNALIPSKSDIKDGLLKMILYSNLSDVKVNGVDFSHRAVLKLTSEKLSGHISSKSSDKELKTFFSVNCFNRMQKELIKKLLSEAKINNFEVKVQEAND